MKLAKNESMNGLPLPDLDTSLSMKLKGEQRFYSIKHGNRPLRVDLCAELVNREEQLQASLLREKGLKEDNERLKGLLRSAVGVAKEAYYAWNYDQDMKCGKMLMALAGMNKGYRADTDAIKAAVTGEQG